MGLEIEKYPRARAAAKTRPGSRLQSLAGVGRSEATCGGAGCARATQADGPERAVSRVAPAAGGTPSEATICCQLSQSADSAQVSAAAAAAARRPPSARPGSFRKIRFLAERAGRPSWRRVWARRVREKLSTRANTCHRPSSRRRRQRIEMQIRRAAKFICCQLPGSVQRPGLASGGRNPSVMRLVCFGGRPSNVSGRRRRRRRMNGCTWHLAGARFMQAALEMSH